YREADGTISGIVEVVSDVTEQVVATQQIEASEQRLSDERMVLYNSFMNAPAGISILKGENHIYEFVNAEYEKSVSRKITLGKTVQEHFPEIEQQGLIDILNNVFSTGEPFIANEFPVELINKSTGKLDIRYYNSAIQPMKDQKGNIERLLSHGVEVTQQVETRKKIEETNHQLRLAATLTENIADAVVGTDMDYKTISWNKGAENLYGYASEEVLGNYAMELLRTQFLSDEDKQSWPIALDSTGKWQGEVVQYKKDGTLVNVLVSIAYVYDENGTPIAAVAVNRDITERKKAEEKIAGSENQFRTFADNIQNLAWIANCDGWIYWYNQQWYDYTGTTLEEMQGWGWDKVHHPDHIKRVIEFVKEAWKKDEPFELTFPLRRHDGEYRWFLTRAYPVKEASGNIERWIGTNTDINEQKIKEEQKDEFISIASHELKTPLTIAKTYIQLLSQTFDESSKENEREMIFTKKANASIDRLNRLISELLDVSKIQSGNLPLHITSFNFDEIFTDTIENLQLTLPKHSIIYSGKTKKQVSGDKERLQQVIINLINNAAKYSPDADKIFVHISDCDKGEIKVEIKDSGIGIAKTDLEKIFERYYRVENMTGQFQGLGIGLFISSEIIRRHNGKLGAESKPGVGSTFYFTLPC
ncbi:MAG: PAS domain S-box protein, partial [Ginsengibacter sp.]